MEMGDSRQWIVFIMIIVSIVVGVLDSKPINDLLTPLLLIAIFLNLPEDPKGGA